MVGDKQDDSIVLHPCALQHVEDLSDLLVDIGDIRKVASPCPADLFGSDIEGLVVAGLEQALRMRVHLDKGQWRDHRVKCRAVLVEIPEFAPGDIGIVRMGELTVRHQGRSS